MSVLPDLLRHSILPIAVLAAVGAAGIARYARTAVLDLARSEWVRTARAKGLGPGRVMFRHLLANALPPLVVLLMLALPGVVAGSVFVESIFAWPGMGRVMLEAISARDYPVVMGATVVYAGDCRALECGVGPAASRGRSAPSRMTRTERWAGGLLVALVVGAIVVPAVARQDPLAIDDVLGARLVGPLSSDDAGRFHLLGTDRFGRDLFVRMMLAGRLSLAIGVVGSLDRGADRSGDRRRGGLVAWRAGSRRHGASPMRCSRSRG